MHRRKRYRDRTLKDIWGQAHITDAPDRATIHSQTEWRGYGFTRFQIIGTVEQIDKAIANILGHHPNNPYGTRFTWPQPTEADFEFVQKSWNGAEVAQDLGNGIWRISGSHSNTAD